MTPLRQRLIHDLQLRGYADRTVEAYVRAVAQLARFYHASPDRLTEEQIRHYLLHLSTVQKVSRGTHTIALCGIKFFYRQTLSRQWTVLDIARPKREKKLPVVLSRDEVWRILAAVRISVYRTCLTAIYVCGLRLMEGALLQVPDVDSERMLLHIHGKRRKDRLVPLPVALTSHRLERFQHGRVTFRYTHARTRETRHLTLPVDSFIARFLQHVLPRGFTKIRSYGLLSPSRRNDLDRARHLLQLHSTNTNERKTEASAPTPARRVAISSALRCPACHHNSQRLVQRYRPSRAPPW